MADTDLPQRLCAGCGATDDHPRINIVERADAPDLLFHYDCVPHYQQHLVPEAAVKATKAGKRGDDVRKAVIAQIEKEA